MIAIIIIFLSLGVMIYQDLKYRHIHVLLPAIVFIAGVYTLYNNYKGLQIGLILQNAFFLLFTFFGLIGYMSLKNRKFLNPFQNYFGLGDLLFYIAISPIFLLYNYILFFIASMVFSIIVFFVFKKIINKESIPLAGYASVLLIFILIHDLVFNTQPLTLIN